MGTSPLWRADCAPEGAVTLRRVPATWGHMHILKSDDRPQLPTDAAARLEALFRSHCAAVASYVRRRTPAESADDIVAETFLVAWRRLEDVPTEPLPWLLAVARNVIATQRRSARRRSALRVRLQRASTELAHQPGIDELGPVASALAHLSEKDQEALTLIAWEGLQPSEAAAVLGESATTFRVRLHRAKRRIKRLLDEQGELPAHCHFDAKETHAMTRAKPEETTL